MKKRILIENDLLGKTIKEIRQHDCLMSIFFNDNSYAVFYIDFGFEAGYGSIEFHDSAITNADDLYRLGIINNYTFTEIEEVERQRSKASTEKFELSEYERLRKKYGNQGLK